MKKGIFLNFLLTAFIFLIVYSTFLLNIKTSSIYLLYIILSLILFITIKMMKKIITSKEIRDYYSKAQKYMIYSCIFFSISLLALFITHYLSYIFSLFGTIIFVIGFLKITMIGKLTGKKR
jgi:hypothetical protein